MKRKALIFGIKGVALTKAERDIIKKYKPWGIILFSRNIKNLLSLKYLVRDIKNLMSDQSYPILIDEEGGKVSRLRNIIDLTLFSQGFFGELYKKNKKDFFLYYKIYTNAVCEILNFVGININTVPVLDVRRNISHNIIGSRSYSTDHKIVSEIGKICINKYKEKKIGNVVKHIPGHGLSKKDTHFHLPIIQNKKKELLNNDFIPFKVCKSFFAMTAHIIYSDFDPINPATHSNIIIDKIIRKYIGFKGVLISDDISMKALQYNLRINTTKALDAGCNIILHCNGNIKEINQLVNIVPEIDKLTQKKTSDFYNFLG